MATVEKVRVTQYVLTLTDEEAGALFEHLGESQAYDATQSLYDALDAYLG